MKGNKVIVIARVSTEQQSYSEQLNELVKAAQELGYSDEQIIEIGYKESAIKVTEEERETIKQMKKHIEEGYVDRVIVWELSRLSRRSSEAVSIRTYLQERRVHLTILKPMLLEVFEKDFSLSLQANMVFLFTSAVAENEMATRKERFRRSKIRNAESGRFSGGIPKRGYRINEKNKYVIDEDEAKFIRLVYDMYVHQKMSIHKIHDELKLQGKSISCSSIRYILRDESYTGKRCKFRKGNLERAYPQIISNELYELARRQSMNNRISCKITPCNGSFLATKLLRCCDCGHNMSPKPKNCLYYCVTHTYPYQSEKIVCDNKCTVRADILDSLIWQLTKDRHIKSLIVDSEQKYKELQKEEKRLIKRKDGLNEQLSRIHDRIEMNENKFIMEDITEKSYIVNKIKLNNNKYDIINSINETNTSINSLRIQIDTISKKRSLSRADINQIVNSVWSIDDPSEKKRLIHQFIRNIYVYYLKDKCKDKVIKIEYNDGIIEYFIHKGYTIIDNQVVLTKDNQYKIIDDVVGFEYEYEEVHLTQAHYVEKLKQKRNSTKKAEAI